MPITLTGRDTPSKRLLQQAINTRMGEKGWTFTATVRWGVRPHGNKLDELKQLAAAGVPTIPFFANDAHGQYRAKQMATGGFVYGRRFHHTKGLDIVCLGPRQIARPRGWRKRIARWEARDFYTRYIPATAEWRLNIAYGRVVCFGQKFRPDGRVLQDPVIRARRLGWHMRRDTRYPEALALLAKRTMEALHCDFGGVDIIETREGPMVLEVNCAVGMDDRTARQYAVMICRRQRVLWRQRQGLAPEREED